MVQSQIDDVRQAKAILSSLPVHLHKMTVIDSNIEELFDVAINILNRNCSVEILNNPRRGNRASLKRARTPSPVRDIFGKQVKQLQLAKSRTKYASLAPEESIPTDIFNKFPETSRKYKLTTSVRLLEERGVHLSDVEQAIERMKNLHKKAIGYSSLKLRHTTTAMI